MTEKSEQVCLRISPDLMAQIRSRQVAMAVKQGKSVSIPKVIISMIEQEINNSKSEWTLMMDHLSTLVESQPAALSVEEFETHQQKVRNIKREDYVSGHAKYVTPVAFYSSEVE